LLSWERKRLRKELLIRNETYNSALRYFKYLDILNIQQSLYKLQLKLNTLYCNAASETLMIKREREQKYKEH